MSGLTEEDIGSLKAIARAGVEPPPFYKAGFHWDRRAVLARNILSRHGIEIRLDHDTGRVYEEER